MEIILYCIIAFLASTLILGVYLGIILAITMTVYKALTKKR